jgi:hypothetical protein
MASKPASRVPSDIHLGTNLHVISLNPLDATKSERNDEMIMRLVAEEVTRHESNVTVSL